MPGNLYVVSGPSGAGKGTLLARALKGRKDFWLSVSATTRCAREGEHEGREYYFLTHEQFQKLIAEDGLLEWAFVHGNYYGTLKSEVLRHLAAGTDVVLEIDTQGAFQVQEKISDAILIFIEPPSLGVLEKRLRARGTETEEQIVARLSHAASELRTRDRYTVAIINDELDIASKELSACLHGKLPSKEAITGSLVREKRKSETE